MSKSYNLSLLFRKVSLLYHRHLLNCNPFFFKISFFVRLTHALLLIGRDFGYWLLVVSYGLLVVSCWLLVVGFPPPC